MEMVNIKDDLYIVESNLLASLYVSLSAGSVRTRDEGINRFSPAGVCPIIVSYASHKPWFLGDSATGRNMESSAVNCLDIGQRGSADIPCKWQSVPKLDRHTGLLMFTLDTFRLIQSFMWLC